MGGSACSARASIAHGDARQRVQIEAARDQARDGPGVVGRVVNRSPLGEGRNHQRRYTGARAEKIALRRGHMIPGPAEFIIGDHDHHALATGDRPVVSRRARQYAHRLPPSDA